MNEFKIRAWSQSRNRWMYFTLEDAFHHTVFSEDRKSWWDVPCLGWDDLVNESRYTGLKDKNGKECYEDDLVKIDDMIYRVQWNGAPNGAGFFLGMHKGSGMSAQQMYKVPDGEIVGNIYENRELLQTSS